jgi:hypothetical protein
MRTITTETVAYKFDELSKEAQEKAIDKHRDFNVSFDDWYEFTIEEFKESNEYFDVDKVYFSGFWSQGDGAMFEYSSLTDRLRDIFIDGLDLTPMRKGWLKNNIAVSGHGKQRGNYYHENSCTHYIYWEVDNGDLHYDRPLYQWLMSFENDFEDFVIDYYKNLCSNLYRDLETGYNYLTSDEVIKELLIENDYEFNINGNII